MVWMLVEFGVAAYAAATAHSPEARRLGNAALAADATQSATCSYLALISLIGLVANALFHVPWFDAAAALVAIPILLKDARPAWKGETCKYW